MRDLLIKSLITVITLAVISLVFIFAETLPLLSFIIFVSISLFIISVIVYRLINFFDNEDKNKDLLE